MSNLSELLNGITGSNSEAVALIGNSLGVLADVSGGAGAILQIIGLFTSANDQVGAQLEKIQTTLLENFTLLNSREKAMVVTQRENRLNDAFREADGVLGTLKADLEADPPLPWGFRSEKIQRCIEAADIFDIAQDDSFWKTLPVDEVYYQDYWSGTMSPAHGLPDDRPIFTDRYTLPAYIRAIHAFVLVIKAFDPDGYAEHFRDNLRRYADQLVTIHDLSAAQIRVLGIPFLTQATCQWEGGEGGTPTLVWYEQNSDYRENTPWMGSGSNAQAGLPSGAYFDERVDTFQPFGAVHLFSGSSSVGKFPPVPNDPAGVESANYHRLTTKVVVAAHARRKDVYRDVGLSELRTTIDSLRTIAGDPRFKGRDPGQWWTLRELAFLVDPVNEVMLSQVGWGSTWRDADVDSQWWETYSVRDGVRASDVLRRLARLSPNSPPTLPEGVALSWRASLEQATMKAPPADPRSWW